MRFMLVTSVIAMIMTGLDKICNAQVQKKQQKERNVNTNHRAQEALVYAASLAHRNWKEKVIEDHTSIKSTNAHVDNTKSESQRGLRGRGYGGSKGSMSSGGMGGGYGSKMGSSKGGSYGKDASPGGRGGRSKETDKGSSKGHGGVRSGGMESGGMRSGSKGPGGMGPGGMGSAHSKRSGKKGGHGDDHSYDEHVTSPSSPTASHEKGARAPAAAPIPESPTTPTASYAKAAPAPVFVSYETGGTPSWPSPPSPHRFSDGKRLLANAFPS